MNKTHINNVFDTSTINVDYKSKRVTKNNHDSNTQNVNDSFQDYNNDDSSIMNTRTIEHCDETLPVDGN